MKRNDSTYPPVGVIIPAAGIGSRMKSDVPKQLLPLAGIPVLVHTCLAFLHIDIINTIVVVVHPDHGDDIQSILETHLQPDQLERILFTRGGVLRQDSVRAGIHSLPAGIEIVLVHDAARPLIDRGTILRTINGAMDKGAVIAAVPVKDTLKRVAPEKNIETTIDRSSLWQAQTPQAAGRSILEHAFQHAAATGFEGTDEASLLEHNGTPVAVVDGDERNIKITRPGDLQLAEQLITSDNLMKIGHGYDTHRLVPDRKLILAGEEVDYHLGLAGHSDADVAAHALIDAILGAMGAGDIGSHFPDNDEQYRNISSIYLLEQIIAEAKRKNLSIGNADLTIICQRPKLASYIEAMKNNLAAACEVEPEAINIKATTTEKMGFAGRGEGIAAHAVVLMVTEHL